MSKLDGFLRSDNGIRLIQLATSHRSRSLINKSIVLPFSAALVMGSTSRVIKYTSISTLCNVVIYWFSVHDRSSEQVANFVSSIALQTVSVFYPSSDESLAILVFRNIPFWFALAVAG